MAAVIGQNFGARLFNRITGTLWRAWSISMLFMLVCTVVCQLFSENLFRIFSDDMNVIRSGVVYLSIFSLGNVMVGTIMIAAAVFQGLGKTYPSLAGAVLDNALFAALVFTLPSFFGWGIQSVWWIKLATAAVETMAVAIWLKLELMRVQTKLSYQFQPA
jgi:Na+-driven multidrug efflux pump